MLKLATKFIKSLRVVLFSVIIVSCRNYDVKIESLNKESNERFATLYKNLKDLGEKNNELNEHLKELDKKNQEVSKLGSKIDELSKDVVTKKKLGDTVFSSILKLKEEGSQYVHMVLSMLNKELDFNGKTLNLESSGSGWSLKYGESVFGEEISEFSSVFFLCVGFIGNGGKIIFNGKPVSEKITFDGGSRDGKVKIGVFEIGNSNDFEVACFVLKLFGVDFVVPESLLSVDGKFGGRDLSSWGCSGEDSVLKNFKFILGDGYICDFVEGDSEKIKVEKKDGTKTYFITIGTNDDDVTYVN